MAINPNSHVPIYQQIVEHICSQVAAGVYQPKDPLPSIRAMAQELVVNPNTIQRSYQELERIGLVRTRKGLGVFVADMGVSPAQGQMETAIYDRFVDGISLGKQTKMSGVKIQSVFRKAMSDLRQPRKNANKSNNINRNSNKMSPPSRKGENP